MSWRLYVGASSCWHVSRRNNPLDTATRFCLSATMAYDDFSGLQAMAENIADGRPVFPRVGEDRYFDEPADKEEGSLMGLLGWCVRASRKNCGGLSKFFAWMSAAPDAERRVILILFERYQGRLPAGAVADIASLAGVSRRTVSTAIKRFDGYFPGAVSPDRRKVE